MNPPLSYFSGVLTRYSLKTNHFPARAVVERDDVDAFGEGEFRQAGYKDRVPAAEDAVGRVDADDAADA